MAEGSLGTNPQPSCLSGGMAWGYVLYAGSQFPHGIKLLSPAVVGSLLSQLYCFPSLLTLIPQSPVGDSASRAS